MTMDHIGVAELLTALRRFGAEATGVEVKDARDGLPRSTRETLSSFSNTHGGGVLLFGISEASGHPVVGLPNPSKIQADLVSSCSDEIVPPVRPTVSVCEIEGGRIVVAEIPELAREQKPAYVKSLGLNRGTYIRVGESDRRLTSEEVQQLVADRGQPAFDRESVPEAGMADLDARAVAGFLGRIRRANPRVFGDETDDVVMRMIGVTRRRPDGSEGITLGGLLALGKYPQQFHPQLNLTFVHYPNPAGESAEGGVRFIDNVSLNGPIPVMVSETLNVLQRNMSRRALITGAGRRDVWDYPVEALREAIVNALVHRDLSPGSRGMQVQVEMYPDRLVVRNAGGLFGPIDIDHLGEEGRSSARNSLLMKLLEDVVIPGEDRTVCENRGSGIRNMIAALRHAGMGLPDFADKVTSFVVTLPNHSLLDDDTLKWLSGLGREGLRDSQCVGLALMRRGAVMDNTRYRAATGIVDSRVATFELQDLVARELVLQTGTRRGARYSLSTYAASEAEGQRRPRPNRRRQILDALELREEASKAEIAAELRMNPKSVEHWLHQMKSEGTIEPTLSGRSKNTKYRVTAAGRQSELWPADDLPPTSAQR